jgi:hypothetical protein
VRCGVDLFAGADPVSEKRGEPMKLLWYILLTVSAGCIAPRAHLSFPKAPIERNADIEWFDVNGDGRRDFAVSYVNGKADAVLYDDDQDGRADRVYRLSDYANDDVPHAVILLDSIPFVTAKERYDAGDFGWFDPPQKSIATFPSLTELCYTEILRAPPTPGMIDRYYDPNQKQRIDVVGHRALGYREPWEQPLRYSTSMMHQGMAYLDPRSWYPVELEWARRAIEDSPDNLTIVYLASASAMVCKLGKPGAEEVLDGARQLCLQLLYERHGAIKISMMADHGHNYTPSKLARLDKLLNTSGFRVADRIEKDDDVVVELNGLVTCATVHTRRAQQVAAVLLKDQAVELAMYQDQDKSIVRSAAGSASIERRQGKLRYVPIDADVLGLTPIIEQLRREALVDPDGFIEEPHWFAATLNQPWPDAPQRIWDALHRQVVNTPAVLVSVRDGFYAGIPEYEEYIKMQSTHGGLNQANSATFVMVMTGRLDHPVRQRDLMRTIEPAYEFHAGR